jgi:uncharacterized membrane protein
MSVHPNSLKNLEKTKIKKGEVRNPLGINRKTPMTDYYKQRALSKLPEKIRKQMNQQLGEEVLPKGALWAEANAVRRFVAAVVGKDGTSDSKEIREAIEGRARQRIEVTGAGGEEIKASVEAKMSTGDLLGAIRAIYGLTEPAADAQRPTAALPVPTEVGAGRITKKNSG